MGSDLSSRTCCGAGVRPKHPATVSHRRFVNSMHPGSPSRGWATQAFGLVFNWMPHCLACRGGGHRPNVNRTTTSRSSDLGTRALRSESRRSGERWRWPEGSTRAVDLKMWLASDRGVRLAARQLFCFGPGLEPFSGRHKRPRVARFLAAREPLRILVEVRLIGFGFWRVAPWSNGGALLAHQVL